MNDPVHDGWLQINELRQQRDDQKSFHSLTSLSSTLKDKETEINRLMEDNISKWKTI